MKQKYGTTIYMNGFIVRRHNRRVSYLQSPSGDWRLSFARVRAEKLVLQEKAHFDMAEERVGVTYTIKTVFLSKEAMEDVSLGMMGYLKAIDFKEPHINLQP